MKKLLSLILSAIMIISMGTVSFAASKTGFASIEDAPVVADNARSSNGIITPDMETTEYFCATAEDAMAIYDKAFSEMAKLQALGRGNYALDTKAIAYIFNDPAEQMAFSEMRAAASDETYTITKHTISAGQSKVYGTSSGAYFNGFAMITFNASFDYPNVHKYELGKQTSAGAYTKLTADTNYYVSYTITLPGAVATKPQLTNRDTKSMPVSGSISVEYYM